MSTKSVEPEKLLTSDEASNLKIAQLENELEQTRRELVEALNSAKNGKNTSEESQAGMDALARARNDLQNLLEGTRLATIFLDTHSRIRSFTPSISEIYPLREEDIGRPLSEISHEALEMPPLPGGEFPENWIESKQREFQTDEGRWFLRRVLPCRQDDQLTGVILTFSEISEQKRAELRLAFAHSVTQLLAVAESFEEVIPEILEAMRSNLDADICAMWLIDADSGSLFCGELAHRADTPRLDSFVHSTLELLLPRGNGLAGRVWETKETLWIDDVGDEALFHRGSQARECGIITGLAIPIFSGKRFHGAIEIFANRALRHEQSKRDMLREVGHEIGQFIRRCRIDAQFRNVEARKSAILEASLDSIITIDIHGKIMDFNVAAETTFDIARDKAVGRPLAEVIIPPEQREAHRDGLQHYLQTGETEIIGKRLELMAMRSDESRFPVELSVSVAHTPDGVPFFTGYLRDITSRNQAEVALRDSEGRAQTLVAASSQMVWTTDAEGKVVEDSPTWRAFTGQTFEEFQGDGWTNVLHPDEREQVFAAWQASNESLQPWIFEYRVRHVSGDWRWTAVRGVPQLCPDGSVLRWVGMNTDITEQKQLQLSLIESEQRLLENQQELIQALNIAKNKSAQLQVLFDQSFYFAGMLDLEGVVIEANETSLVLCGYEREEVIGCKFWECPWWSGSNQIQDTIRRAVERSKKGVFYRAELPYWLSDGSQRLVDFVLTPALNEIGEVIFIVPTGSDITEKKQAEQRLTMALKAGGMAAWEWTPNGSVWTDALYELLGLPSGSPASPEVFFDLVHPDDLPNLKEAWARATLGYEAYDEQFRITRPSGEVRWLAAVGEFERNDEGDVVRVVGLNWDVTEEHAAADALRESEMEAQEANRAKSDFLANMSHEIRTPMTAMLGYADLLAKEETNPEKSQYLQVIKRNGLFLLEIINDILDLSKIEAGKIDVSRERFNVQKVVADVRSTMDVRAREKQLEFVVEYEGKIPATIESDPKRLKQILVNLVGNAIKFTESGSVQLQVSYLKDLPQPLLRFDVIDTGIGIPQEKMSLLFQPFSQADSSVSRKFGGTGLGLTICRRLAHVLGGQIKVISEAGKGSTFSCTIQVGDMREVDLVEPKSNQIDLQRETDASNNRLCCRVLVVDDRRDVRFLTQRILRDAGAEVSLAEDGLDAIRQLKQSLRDEHIWDLILLDMQMPRLDGYQAATKIREMGFKGAIIALTADAMQGDMGLCLECGCDAYLSKPIDTHKLLTMISKYTNPTSCIDVAEMRVLVVDDCEDACTATQKLLELRGFQVQTAFDGASALREAESFVPHSIVLDISLPDMSGFDVLNRLKQMPQLNTTRFYALTGDGRTSDPCQWQQAGFHHHMTKPTDMDLLVKLLRDGEMEPSSDVS
ncbi:PAS domain S-box protein [Bythopirellula polymerisocia]|uniref:PAS domain S-box protein n=1 Tax=Bythopirellula polymerisocia TaxID=2528003 RepID=UPI0018D40AB9|nr:PAS domain S-box protein [Bythopirellula polymerisocia]